LTTPATYSFSGFPGQPDRYLYLHHDGYPTGAAWRFAAALRICGQLAEFPTCFVNTQPGSIPLAGPDAPTDAAYRYRVEFQQQPNAELQVQVWRRLPGSDSWMPRSGVMPLKTFIKRFLPAPDQCRSASR
jgi:hypothetical protein